MAAGFALSFGILFLPRHPAADDASVDGRRAAVSAHYGSISAVTLVAVMNVLSMMGITFEGYMICRRRGHGDAGHPLCIVAGAAQLGERACWDLAREILLNGAVVMFLGSFAIGVVVAIAAMRP